VVVLALVLAVPVYLAALPAAHAATPGNAELAPGKVDQNAGAFTTSVAIAVPAFHGLEPKLGLVYSSLGRNGEVGLGWQLAGESRIERFSPGRGAPTYTSSDVFLLDGEEMVASNTLGGTHVTKRQNFQRISFDAVANTWTVKDKNGVKSTYAARFDVAAGKTVRWMLSSVADMHSNTVNYGYTCDGALECYLHTVSYNGTVVTLYDEARPDPFSYAEGDARARMNWRVMTIDVVVSGSRARTYGLAYSTSPTTGRSLLSSVTRYGRDAVVDTTGAVSGVIGKITSGSKLPPVTFTYTADTVTYTPGPVRAGWCTETLRTGDFNGDGKTDLLCHNGTTFNNTVALSDGLGGFTAQPKFGPFCNAVLSTGDFDGDGKTDLLCHDGTTFSNTVALSDGAGGFIREPSFGPFCNSALRTGDFDGDGRTDLLCRNGATFSNIVALSDGTGGFTREPAFGPWCSASSFNIGDFDGDGKTDLLCRDVTLGLTSVALSDGLGGFSRNPAFGGWCIDPKTVYGMQLGTGDFNGDGKTDLWCHDPLNAATYVAFSTGSGGFIVAGVFSGWCNVGTPTDPTRIAFVTTGDYNGDGKTDLLCRNPDGLVQFPAMSNGVGGFASGSWFVWCASSQFSGGDFNGDGKTDLLCHEPTTGNSVVAWTGAAGRTVDRLSTLTNELGGVTTVGYTPSSSWPVGTTGAGLIQPPPILPTVSQVMVGDGLGHTVTTRYAYSGGRWDSAERRFLGYAQVTATDSSGAYSVTSFQVEAGYPANRVALTQRFSPTGVLVESSSTSYTESTTGGVFTSLVGSTSHSWCQGAALCQTTRSDMVSYDMFGNTTQVNDFGDIGVPGDDKTTITTFVQNVVLYMVNRPNTVTVRAGLGVTGAQVQLTEYGYSGPGDLIRTIRWLNTTNAGVRSSALYDAFGNKISVTDEIGKLTSWTYDPTYHTFQTGQCQASATCGPTVCTATALCSAQSWDTVLGLVTTSTDVNASVTSWQYDSFGRVTTESRPDGSSTATTYVSWGTPGAEYVQTAESDGTPDGLWSRTYPDGQGRTVKTVAEPDITVLTTYNPQGLKASVSNPFKGTAVPAYTTYGYDAAGRQTTLTHPDGSTVNTTYAVVQNPLDADFATPRLTKVTCTELALCTRLAYDGANHDVVTSEWDGVGTASTLPEYRTRAVYDVLGNNTTVTDSLGNVSTMGWDSLGRKISMSDPDGGLWTYDYDAAGHLTSQTDANKKTLTSTYNDPLGRLTSVSAGTTVLITNHYDETGHGAGNGRLTSTTDVSGSTSWSFDTMGRTTEQTKTIGGVAYTVGQTFDPAGRRKSLTYPDGQIITYTYDASGCVTTVAGYVTAAVCTPTQNSQTLGNGVVMTQNLDPNRIWLASDTAVKGTTVLQNESYTYRTDGRVSAKTSSDATDQWTYGYDNLGRLTAATNTTNTAYSSTYAYDQIGRIISDAGAGAGLGTRTYPTVGTGHTHAPSTATAGTVSYIYDAAGNLTNDGGGTYGYDAQNRLATSTINGVTTSYTYDGQGTRVQAGTVKFVELGGQLLYQIDGTASTDFIYYGAQRIARRDSTGTVSYYVGDRLGSPHLILDATGTVQRTVLYGPYGAQLAATGTVTDPFGQAGDYRDPSGLYKRGVRYQAARTTQFTSPDPSGSLDPTKPQTLNRYAYAGNDPINFVDHTGKEAWATSGVTTNTETGKSTFDLNLGLATFHYGPGENSGEITYGVGAYLSKGVEGQYAVTIGSEGWTKQVATLGNEVEVNGYSLGVALRLSETVDDYGDYAYSATVTSSVGVPGQKYDIPFLQNAYTFWNTVFSAPFYMALAATSNSSGSATFSSPEDGSPFESAISARPVLPLFGDTTGDEPMAGSGSGFGMAPSSDPYKQTMAMPAGPLDCLTVFDCGDSDSSTVDLPPIDQGTDWSSSWDPGFEDGLVSDFWAEDEMFVE
jgi:RHS repeat-associated protein